jgi:hypothetical protein
MGGVKLRFASTLLSLMYERCHFTRAHVVIVKSGMLLRIIGERMMEVSHRLA